MVGQEKWADLCTNEPGVKSQRSTMPAIGQGSNALRHGAPWVLVL